MLDQFDCVRNLSTGAACESNCIDLKVIICIVIASAAVSSDVLAWAHRLYPDAALLVVGENESLGVDAIRNGATDFVHIACSDDLHRLPLAIEKSLVHHRIRRENHQLHTDLRKSLTDLATTNGELQAVIHQLESLARTDELTGLSNRRWFNLMLEGHWAEATRHNLPLACVMIDLDGFKLVNDQLGHHHGDELLRLAARVLKANCRENDVPARYGGDEFCILMAHAQPTDAIAVALRILREFDLAIKGRPVSEPCVSMSVGIAHINVSRPVNAVQLVNHADEAMYGAKAGGKRRVMLLGHNCKAGLVTAATSPASYEIYAI